ncbi:hypothetical protein MIND_01171700 [Mycena indigotica]|uniref:Hikeshi-like domain-containing protein n=1 Tax=Mycena indigotica TaxID=2126181 RepID=A0A8H6VYE7_9AGAR|nr:uncharacterized protein MIND_01171700 [Mycena indigotica]KAF7292734.1 hypothetical protein MIND_01171700 [Mycena indigotica]
MFGCCVAGRLLQTNLQQIDETHAMFELPAASSINHVCVFLLGTVPFPEGYGCTVHFFWPGKGFQLLGMLSNEKPSAIFRLKGTYSPQRGSSAAHSAFSASSQQQMSMQEDVTAVLGLAIEPLGDIAAQIAALHSTAEATSTTLVAASPLLDPARLAERVVKHLFNYISGFTGGSVGGDVSVPMGLIVKWYESFVGKLRNGGAGFLERVEECANLFPVLVRKTIFGYYMMHQKAISSSNCQYTQLFNYVFRLASESVGKVCPSASSSGTRVL